MTVQVLAFGIAKDIFGASSININLDVESVDVDGLKAQLEHQFPRLQQLSSYMIAVNNEYARGQELITSADEIAVIPPVSGG